MKKTWNTIRKTLIAVLGVLVVIIGVILIPLPGPGLLIVFAGLLILSIEFEWARYHRDNIKRQLSDITTRKK